MIEKHQLLKQYPQLSNKEIDRILVDYREYQNLISATENLMDFL